MVPSLFAVIPIEIASCIDGRDSAQVAGPHFSARYKFTSGGSMKREIGKQLAWLAVITCLLMLSCASLWGQATASASLQGTVVDKSQAVLGKANVTITNKETGASRTTQTNDLGEYRFDLLPAGIYTVKTNAQGFSAAEAKNVEVLIGGTATQNFTLNPGNVNEIVEVTSAAPIVDLEKTDVSTNITPQQISE